MGLEPPEDKLHPGPCPDLRAGLSEFLRKENLFKGMEGVAQGAKNWILKSRKGGRGLGAQLWTSTPQRFHPVSRLLQNNIHTVTTPLAWTSPNGYFTGTSDLLHPKPKS